MAENIKWLNEKCSVCGNKMNSWDMKLTHKFKAKNTCEKCFCDIYGLSERAFRARMESYFALRPCQGI